MVGIDLEVVAFSDFREHRLHDVVADLPLTAAASADQVVMRLEARDLIVRFAVAGVGCHDDIQIHEESHSAVDGGAVDRLVRSSDPQVDLTERCVAISGADRFQNERPLAGHTVTGVPECLFPAQLIVRQRL